MCSVSSETVSSPSAVQMEGLIIVESPDVVITDSALNNYIIIILKHTHTHTFLPVTVALLQVILSCIYTA